MVSFLKTFWFTCYIKCNTLGCRQVFYTYLKRKKVCPSAGVSNLRPVGHRQPASIIYAAADTCELKNKYCLYYKLETFIRNKGQNRTFSRATFAP